MENDITKSMKGWPVVMLRLYAGAFFLHHGLGILPYWDGFPAQVSDYLRQQPHMFGFYRAFSEAILLAHVDAVAWVVTGAEIALGAALLMGLAVRYAGIAGALLMLNFWCATGNDFLGGVHALWAVVLLVLGLIPAGRVWGLDAALGRRFRFLR